MTLIMTKNFFILFNITGKPMYYLEVLLGQFTSQSSIKIWSICPSFIGKTLMFFQIFLSLYFELKIVLLIFIGVGIGQAYAGICVLTYYSSLLALTLYYFVSSFHKILPWSYCREEWGPICVDSNTNVNTYDNNNYNDSGLNAKLQSSSELYFL